jgi:hypothetical protein
MNTQQVSQINAGLYRDGPEGRTEVAAGRVEDGMLEFQFRQRGHPCLRQTPAKGAREPWKIA